MVYDPKYADLFIANFREAHRFAKLLASSLERVAPLMPVEPKALDSLSSDDKDKLDAFRVRFSDLQDILGQMVFRGIIVLEEEKTGSQLDTINKIVKREIVESFDDWKALCEIRNLFSHEYPESDDERAQALNLAYAASPKLLKVVDTVNCYSSEKIGIVMDQFEKIT